MTEVFKVHASSIYFMSRCCSTRISSSQEPAAWGWKPISHGSSFSLCPSPELWALGSPSATAVSWFGSLISRLAWKSSQRGGGQQAPSVSMCLQGPVAGDAASLWATWDVSRWSPDILRESLLSGEGMKLKANPLPREWGCLAAKQRKAVCCQTLSKISQRGNKSAVFFPQDVNLSSLAAPCSPGWGRRGHFGPAQTSPRHPSGAVCFLLNELWQ